MLMMVAVLCAGITYRYQMETPIFKDSTLGIQVKLRGAESYGTPGEPDLPFFGYSLLLPEGNEATGITVKREGAVVYPLGSKIAPVQPQYPLSHPILEELTMPDPLIYKSEEMFPPNPAKGLRTEFLNGHAIAFGAFSPFEYHPQRDELVFYKYVTVEIDYQTGERAANALNLMKKDAIIAKRLQNSVDNMDAIPQYNSNRDTGVEYLMIIDGEKLTNWQPLADFYESYGISVMFKPVSEIAASGTGQDLQDKIRNYIIGMYQANPLRYVLLGGDTDVIPHRGFTVDLGAGSERDEDIPADMYYSCLDGNWNTDGDAFWGEPMEADLAPELAIGRICYNNDAEIANQINKITLYQLLPVESQVKTVNFIGEWLWDGPTWAGDYMDEMIGGSGANGYSTEGVPPSWNITTLYDRTYGYADAWGAAQVRPLLSQGANLVNHLGHSATTYNMRLSNNGVSATSITNNGIDSNYSIYFTQGCYAGSFDNRDTSPGSYTSDSITEKFTSITTAAAGMISHSRYGWGVQGSTNGASQRFHRQYIDAIFGENIHELGYTLVDSKIDNIPYITNNPVMYWVSYETNLFGCPVTNVWSDTPQLMTVNLPGSWLVGLNTYTVVTNAADAHLKLKQNGELVYEGYADAMGTINVSLTQNLVPGPYQVFINAPNFHPYNNTIYVTASQMPYIVCEDVVLSDEDGLLHTGEAISVSASIKNLGLVDLQGSGTISMSSESSNIEILQGTFSFSDVDAGDSLDVSNVFQFRVTGSFADHTFATLVFNASYGEYQTQSFHRVTLAAPILSLQGYQIQAPGVYVMPGDHATISFELANAGSGHAFSPLLLIFPGNEEISSNVYELALDPVYSGESTVYANSIPIYISESAEIGTTLSMNYMIAAENGNSMEGSFQVHIGLMSYGFEPDYQNWSTAQLNSQFVDQWHRSSARNNTPGGNWSMKFGGQGSAQYAASAHGALISPEIAIAHNSTLKFWHWMDAEDHDDYQNQAWDGGFVQMSVNGGSWNNIAPVGGYPKIIYNNPASPLSAGTPVYSGSFSWTEAVFNLGKVSGIAQFRFVFGSDSYVGGEGWYIDDVRVEADPTSNSDDVLLPAQVTLQQNYPNPFNPNTNIAFFMPKAGKVQLSIYNLKGQLVKDLVNQEVPAGHSVFAWDGRDYRGTPVASGIYSYRLHSENYTSSKKMILMK
jgi:hypothetical protein